jgi:hypothetical protein
MISNAICLLDVDFTQNNLQIKLILILSVTLIILELGTVSVLLHVII